uniref:(northern house mosquito) hypothetical protein n=1 Tax=Culex pipiens TaxID=7175 RepID=A0A8D8F704_CULPI
MLRSDSQPGPIVLRGRSPEKCLRQHSGHGRDQQAVLQTVHSRSLRARPVAGNEERSHKGTGRHLCVPTGFHPVRIAAAERRHRMPTAGRRISQVFERTAFVQDRQLYACPILPNSNVVASTTNH